MQEYKITDKEFNQFRSFIYDEAGINLSDEKKALVTARLGKRLRHHNFSNYTQYYNFVEQSGDAAEKQIVVDLLTTNETYFFREPKHFVFLERKVVAGWKLSRPFRVWSAASSSGEEAYSIAMLLAETMGSRPWEVFASDISSRVLKKATSGIYTLDRIDGIPKDYLRKYCLKGVDEYEGHLMINRSIRDQVTFASINLKNPFPNIGLFDVVFLRNVMIYFDNATKRKIVERIVDRIQPGGYLIVGHSEAVTGLCKDLRVVMPTVYQKVRDEMPRTREL
jgi:chemotaxis protein methyltransferase CheR